MGAKNSRWMNAALQMRKQLVVTVIKFSRLVAHRGRPFKYNLYTAGCQALNAHAQTEPLSGYILIEVVGDLQELLRISRTVRETILPISGREVDLSVGNALLPQVSLYQVVNKLMGFVKLFRHG